MATFHKMTGYRQRFKSNKQDWETPDWLFHLLHTRFNFTCDVAAAAHNAKLPHYIDAQIDALTVPWHGTCWLNPPYRENARWVAKAYHESLRGVTVVCLIPARTNTNWWHDYCMNSHEIILLHGRPRFKGAKYGLPQPLAIVVFRSHDPATTPILSTLDVRNKDHN